ncbi:hypothetical protein CPC08DRAFT_210170 [Agrocybe pediades]|nr:hypothetical protein CPC08DRAFT_210170 [Agrocybe pediades]
MRSRQILPFELERMICEYAVFESRNTAARIIRVARRFKTWFEPELYRIVKRTGLHQCPTDLDKTVHKPMRGGMSVITWELDASSIRRFGPWVHHLFLQHRYELAIFLQHCPNIFHLEFGSYTDSNCVRMIPLLEKLPLRRLCFEPCSFFKGRPPYKKKPYSGPLKIPFDQPMFHGLTHLEITTYRREFSDSDYGELALLPRLTHLAFDGCCWDPDMKVDSVISSLVRRNQRIKLLVIIFESEWHFKAAVPKSQHRDNTRVVFLTRIPDGELDRDIGRGLRTEKAFWRMAEAMQQEAVKKGGHPV